MCAQTLQNTTHLHLPKVGLSSPPCAQNKTPMPPQDAPSTNTRAPLEIREQQGRQRQIRSNFFHNFTCSKPTTESNHSTPHIIAFYSFLVCHVGLLEYPFLCFSRFEAPLLHRAHPSQCRSRLLSPYPSRGTPTPSSSPPLHSPPKKRSTGTGSAPC